MLQRPLLPRRRPGRARLTTALVLVASATAAMGVPGAQAAATTCGPGGTVEDIGNGWLSASPSYPAGVQATSLVAAAIYDTNLIYATNGSVLMRSVDAGCGWSAVFTATTAAGALPGTDVAITALHVPSSANSSSYVYVGVTTTSQGVATPEIAVSSDRGKTFRTTDVNQGLDAVGRVTEIAASATIPQIAYAGLATRLPALTTTAIFGTSDAGASWTDRTGRTTTALPAQLVVDPLGQTDLFGLSAGRVARSSNGAATFGVVDGDPGGLVARLTAAPGAGGLRLAGARADAAAIATSTDAGATWTTVPSPVRPSSLAVAPLRDLVGVTAGNELLLLDARAAAPPVAVSPTSPGSFGSLTLTAPTGAGFAAVGLWSSAVARLALSNALTPIGLAAGRLGPVQLQPAGPLAQFPSTLLPGSLSVSLPAGGSRLVPYDLLVPRTPTPVDVMFLVDSTGSMSSVIEELRVRLVEIVNALDNAGLNIRFGIGDYRDYPDPYGTAGRFDWPYRLDRVVGPVDRELQDAIGQIQAGGGTSDGKASPLTALVQAATGAGDALDDHVFVDPGEGAQFRPNALKLAMVAGDTEAHFGGESIGNNQLNPGPDFESTIATLLARDVHMMGLAVGTAPLRNFRELADGSQTYAPAGGVDCNGDGKRDLAAGDPLVCQIGSGGVAGASVSIGGTGTGTGSANGLTAALVGLAAGIPDIKPVGLAVTRGQGFARLASPGTRSVNLRADNQLAFAVRLSCPLGAASRQSIALTAVTGSRQLATGAVNLTCGGVPAAPLLPAIAGPPAAADPTAAAPPAPGQPGPNAPNPNPNPNPNANVNPAANANVNPGVAGQEQDQQQLAFAEDAGASETLAMSGLAFVAAAGLLTCVAGGFAVRRRTSTVAAR